MPRAAVSPADQALLDDLDDRGATATRYQLERWRRLGLLPRPLVTYLGTGTKTNLTADSVDIAEVLAHVSRRGRPWQLAAIWLYQYGAVPSETALRETGAWLLNRTQRAVQGTVSRLSVGDQEDELAAVEELIASFKRSHMARPDRTNLLEAIRSRHPHLSQRELRERADAAELWTTYFVLHPAKVTSADHDLLAVADGFADYAEAKSHGWSPRRRTTVQISRKVATTVTRPEMLALARWYDHLADEPGFEYLERGAFRFEHAIADLVRLRRDHARNLTTPLNPRYIYELFGGEAASAVGGDGPKRPDGEA